ncbi:unnamed protein product [Ixodes pacificus]
MFVVCGMLGVSSNCQHFVPETEKETMTTQLARRHCTRREGRGLSFREQGHLLERSGGELPEHNCILGQGGRPVPVPPLSVLSRRRGRGGPTPKYARVLGGPTREDAWHPAFRLRAVWQGALQEGTLERPPENSHRRATLQVRRMCTTVFVGVQLEEAPEGARLLQVVFFTATAAIGEVSPQISGCVFCGPLSLARKFLC